MNYILTSSLCLLTIISLSYAAIQCPENEEIKQAEVSEPGCTACEPTCTNQNPMCEGICAPPDKCFCKEGFVRDELGKCITPENCTNKIRVTRHLKKRQVGTQHLKKRQVGVGTGVYYPGAGLYGNAGLVGNGLYSNGVGYGVGGEPPAACRANEVWHQCGLACIQTCQNPAPICPTTCAPAQAGCTCTLGNVRDLATGQCLPQGTYCSSVGK